MNSKRVWNFANNSARINVEYLDLGSVGGVEATGFFVNGEVIPTALTGNGDSLDYVITRGGLSCRNRIQPQRQCG